jgi:superoxide dismutase, Cu-Zn family
MSMARNLCLLAVALVAVPGCEHGRTANESQAAAGAAAASARVAPTQGNQVEGTVSFQKASGGVRVIARLSGLRPGLHGFHVHTNGDCSAPDGSSAGDHFNPTNTRHGDRYDEQAHIGDMGNVVADDSGQATLDYVDPHMTLDGQNSIVGRSVVVHANQDDLQTQPSGNSGPRVGCGVIQAGD